MVYSYFESRGGEFGKNVFFGLQYILRQYLEGRVVTQEKIDEAEMLVNKHMGSGTFNREGWEYILHQHDGRLPVCIKAVDEGTLVPTRNVLVTIENTDPNCYWLTNYLETLLVQMWYPTTVATQSYYMKKDIEYFLKQTCDEHDPSFRLHDFGFRGSTVVEGAGIGGCAHLAAGFQGTDTFEAIRVAKHYYDCDMAGFSVPASEHSTITSWGRESEVDAFANMLEQYEKYPIIACVSDSYDIFHACKELWGNKLRDVKVLRNFRQ
jgi:nicotinamide phosphoribosyltransferase